MAVINSPNKSSASLQAFTLAALALPGVMLATNVVAEEDQVSVQYGHYQEGKRDLGNVQSQLRPIEVDSLFAAAKIKFTDRVKFGFNYTQDTWGGATPIATAPLALGANRPKSLSGASPLLNPGSLKLDAALNPLALDPVSGQYTSATQLVHTLSSASPETRKQGDVKLTYEWDKAALDGGAGISEERDYQSIFGNLGGRLDFNQKRTTLNLGMSYTSSTTKALLDHDATPYIYETSAGLKTYNSTHSASQIELMGALNGKTLHAEREDWGSHLGLTQILNKNALLEAGISYTLSTGYMDNPYKTVTTIFVDPNQTPTASGILNGETRALLEKRPDERNQWAGSLRYVQHLEAFDASLHFDYRIFHDDWGIDAHTFEADWIQPIGNGWSVTPRVRYYSQDAADFYHPYLVSKQATPGKVQSLDNNGNATTTPLNYAALPANYSSDHRLSGYGALSGGITVSKKFAKGVGFEAGAEYYTHAGSLKLGGGGEGAYADFSSYMVNAAVKVDLSALSLPGNVRGEHTQHNHHSHSGGHAPAGVMFDHMLANSGDMMVGYRYMYMTQGGHMLKGDNDVSDAAITSNGCNGTPCYVTPHEMNMHMHMLDFMYAPTQWLTLMLMPQFVDMNMDFRRPNGSNLPNESTDSVTWAAAIHADHLHATGGIGDTGMYALFKVFENAGQHVHATLGLSAPTGDVGIQLRDTHGVSIGFIHYGMQLGSGTWDFKPSITYTGKWDDWSWGAQINGTKRLENQNTSGFALGDMLQTTAWGSYSLKEWLSLSIRGVYTVNGALKGAYNGTYSKVGPMDYTNNYGGRYWDVGFGINATIPTGELQGNRFGFEWLEPVYDDVNGYQLPREGALSATWSFGF